MIQLHDDDVAQRAPAVTMSARQALGWTAAFAGLLAYAVIWRDTYIDDAYITLQYARALGDHLTWGFHPGHLANTATSPLNVVVLALAGLPAGTPVNAVVWVTAAQFAAMLWLLLRISRRILGTAHFGVVAFVALVTNPLLVSTIGLEGSLFTLLMVGAVELFLGRRWVLLGVCLGLLTLTRLDGALLFVLVLLLAPVRSRTAARMALAYGLTLLPWELFSWVRLGSLVPDTLLIKLGQDWSIGTFATGLGLYRERYPVATLATLLLLPFAPLATLALRRASTEARRVMAAVALYGILHFAVYAVLGVPPYHWYYLHQVVPIVVWGSLGAAHLLRRWARAPARAVRLASYAPAVIPAVVLLAVIAPDGFPPRQAPIHTNWALPGEYRAVGEWLRGTIDPSDAVDLHGEVGTLAYYSERTLVDVFADTNRVNAHLAQFKERLPPAVAWIGELNFTWREDQEPFPEPSYLLTPRPVDPATAPEGPLMTWDVSSPWAPHTRISLYRLQSRR